MIIDIRKYIGLAGGLVLLFLVYSAEIAYSQKITLRGSDNYPPFEYLNESGEPEGFNVDMIRALMKELKLDYDLKLGEWNKVVEDIQGKKIDIVIGMIYSPERAEHVRFSFPTCTINRSLITRESSSCKSLDDLKDKEVIVERGGWFHRYLQNTGFNGKIVESDDIDNSLRLLSEGKYDAALAGELTASYAMKKLHIRNLNIGDLGIEPQNYGIAVNQDQDELLYQINLGLQRLKLSGVYDQIYNRWFGIYEDKDSREGYVIIFVVFFVIALLLAIVIWVLRRRVAKTDRLLNSSREELGIAIDAGKVSAWTYLIRERVIKAVHGNSLGSAETPVEKFYETIHPEDIELVREEFDALSAGNKKTATISFRVLNQEGGDYRYVETMMVCVEATKDLPRRIVGTLKDITEEVVLRQKLETYKLKSEFVTRANSIILIQFDIAAQTFSRISDHESKKQIVYTVEQYYEMVYPEDLPLAREFVARLNKAQERQIETEYRILSNNGEYDWYIVTATAYRYDKQGNIISYMGLRHNNTKWRMINNELVMMREKAEASNRLKSAFLANMSHEIRTPLNAIVGFSELIIDMEDKQEQAQFVNIIRTNNELLLKLINDVLDLSRIEAGYINFAYDTFNFSSFFEDLGRSLQIHATEKVKLEYVNRYEDVTVCSDRSRITQVITNFVTNAFKFTPSGSIRLDYVYENDGIKVSVTDTGIGIAAENLGRIFDRFEKLNDFAQGTGLGLSICKVIVEALQGIIGVDSQPGVGSAFWFWLPCSVEKEAQHIEIRHAEPEIKVSGEFISGAVREVVLEPDKKTVLIAEDIDNNFVILHTIMKDKYNVIRAGNGIEAVEKARRYNPDVILMDMKMPYMGGLEATKEIRKFSPDVPIIALTAYVFDTNKKDAMNAGCSGFLTKPVNRNILMEVVDKCL